MEKDQVHYCTHNGLLCVFYMEGNIGMIISTAIADIKKYMEAYYYEKSIYLWRIMDWLYSTY